MAEENQESQEEGDEGEGQKKGGLKKIILIAGLVLLLLIGAGGGAAVMLGVFDPPPDESEQAEAPVEVQLEPEAVFLEIPDLIVNLNSTGRKATFLKIKIALEVETPKKLKRSTRCCPESSTTSRCICVNCESPTCRGRPVFIDCARNCCGVSIWRFVRRR